MSMSCVAFIFARGGSKGMLRKNLCMLGDKPLLGHAIETALKSTLIDRVVVSTEDVEIAEVAKQYGAEVPFMRPVELAQDDSPEILAWRHGLLALADCGEFEMGSDIFVVVPCTAPLRTADDIDCCIQTMKERSPDIVITVRDAARHPEFNMVQFGQDGYLHLVQAPKKNILRRQDSPVVYDMTTVCYVVSPSYVLSMEYLLEGRVEGVKIPDLRALDIDTELDLLYARFLLTTGLLNQSDEPARLLCRP